MIRSVNLSKTFHSNGFDVTAVNSISLRIGDGEVFGILGPNGAGKTTLFRLLSCLLKPTSGTAEVSGYDVVREPMEVRGRVGLLCEEPGLYDRQSVRDNLDLFGALYGLDKSRAEERVGDLAESLDFRDLLEKKAGTLSKGQRQKVSLARALLHEPEVLLLDEPTANLDPVTAELVRDSIRSLKTEKRTILVSSHNLDEVQRMCERVAVIDDGEVLGAGPIETLSNKLWMAKTVNISLKADRRLEGQGWLREIEKLPIVDTVSLEPESVAQSPLEDVLRPQRSPPLYYVLEVVLTESATEEEAENVTSGIVKVIATSVDARVTKVARARHSLQDTYLKLLHDKGVDDKVTNRVEGAS